MAPSPAGPGETAGEPAGVFKTGGVEVRTTRSVLPNHLWIGVNGAPASGNGHSGNSRLLRSLPRA
jgi:hypothetical protein